MIILKGFQERNGNVLINELKNSCQMDATVMLHKRDIMVESQKAVIKIEIPPRSSCLRVYPCWQKRLRSICFNMRTVSIKALVGFIKKMPETNGKLVELLTPALIKYQQMTSCHGQYGLLQKEITFLNNMII